MTKKKIEYKKIKQKERLSWLALLFLPLLFVIKQHHCRRASWCVLCFSALSDVVGARALPLYADATPFRQFRRVFVPFLCLRAVVIKPSQVCSFPWDERCSWSEKSFSLQRHVRGSSFSVRRDSAISLLIISCGPEVAPFRCAKWASVVARSRRKMFIPSGFTVNESDTSADLFSTISGAFSNVISPQRTEPPKAYAHSFHHLRKINFSKLPSAASLAIAQLLEPTAAL